MHWRYRETYFGCSGVETKTEIISDKNTTSINHIVRFMRRGTGQEIRFKYHIYPYTVLFIQCFSGLCNVHLK